MRRIAIALVVFCLLFARTVRVEGQKRAGSSAIVNGGAHEQTEISIDLPLSRHVKNFGAPKDGAGLCVFASMQMAADWSHVLALMDIMKKVEYGGGYPQKVDQVFKEFAPSVKYVQYEGTDPSLLDRAIADGHPACVTYGYGERYGMQTIHHMVLLVHIDKKWAVILDNNFPKTYEWMSRDEFLARWKHPDNKGWAYVILEAPPPPVPRN